MIPALFLSLCFLSFRECPKPEAQFPRILFGGNPVSGNKPFSAVRCIVLHQMNFAPVDGTMPLAAKGQKGVQI